MRFVARASRDTKYKQKGDGWLAAAAMVRLHLVWKHPSVRDVTSKHYHRTIVLWYSSDRRTLPLQAALSSWPQNPKPKTAFENGRGEKSVSTLLAGTASMAGVRSCICWHVSTAAFYSF